MKNGMIIALSLFAVFVVGGVLWYQGSGLTFVTIPDNCDGDSACEQCTTQSHTCSQDGQYELGYRWDGDSCQGPVTWNLCTDGCVEGKCNNFDYGQVCLPVDNLQHNNLLYIKEVCEDTGSYFGDTTICNGIDERIQRLVDLQESSLVCTHTLYSNGDLLCNIDDLTTCQNGCTPGFTECNDEVASVCIDGNEVCSDGVDFDTYDENGDSYFCVNGQWELSNICTGDQKCEEQSSTNAICRIPADKYCLNNNFNCVLCSNQDGYDTQEECESSIIYVCLTTDKTQCIQREGGCLDGELSTRGSNPSDVFATCQAKIENAKMCSVNNDCDDNNTCTIDTCKTDLFEQKCENKFISNCEEKKQCEEKFYQKWIEKTTKTGGYVCKFLNIGCTESDDSYCSFRYELVIIPVVLIVLGSGIFILGKKYGWFK